MWFPVDLPMPSEFFTARTQTQQSTTPRTQGMLLPLSWRTLDGKSTLTTTQNGTSSLQTTYAKAISRNTGIAVSPASGLWFSALFNEDAVQVRSVPDSGRYSIMGASEEFLNRELLARVAFDINSSAAVGLALRGQRIKGDVVGSFSALTTDRTIYSGQRMGIAAATTLSLQSVKIALRYESPVTGKVSIGGESKVSASQGLLGAAVNFSQSDSLHLRGEYITYEFAKNELATSVRSNDKTQATTISPLGLAVDARLLPLSVMGIGLQNKFGGNLRFDADLVLGKVHFVSSPDLVPAKTIPDDQVLPMYAGRFGVSIDKSDLESQIFVDYSSFRSTRSEGQTKLLNASTQWGVGLRSGVEL